MTTEIDDIAVPAALELINEFGINATFIAETKVYDDVTQSTTSTATTIVRKVSPPQEAKTWRDGEVLRESKALVYLAASGLTFTPAIGMKVTIDGTSYGITKAVAIRSGELIAIWELRLD